jgi:hypothetical protein
MLPLQEEYGRQYYNKVMESSKALRYVVEGLAGAASHIFSTRGIRIKFIHSETHPISVFVARPRVLLPHARNPIMWKAENVTHALVHAVTAEKLRPYVVVGIDGRFLMSPLLLLPRR